MTLNINKSYATDAGYLIPRSRFSEDTMPRYAVFEICTQDGNRYIVKHKTLTKKDVREMLRLNKNEKVEII